MHEKIEFTLFVYRMIEKGWLLASSAAGKSMKGGPRDHDMSDHSVYVWFLGLEKKGGWRPPPLRAFLFDSFCKIHTK